MSACVVAQWRLWALWTVPASDHQTSSGPPIVSESHAKAMNQCDNQGSNKCASSLRSKRHIARNMHGLSTTAFLEHQHKIPKTKRQTTAKRKTHTHTQHTLLFGSCCGVSCSSQGAQISSVGNYSCHFWCLETSPWLI